VEVPDPKRLFVDLRGDSVTNVIGKIVMRDIADGVTLLDPFGINEGTQINNPTGDTIWVNERPFGLSIVSFEGLIAAALKQEEIDALLRAAAQAEFFMKPPLWIEIMMEEEEEEGGCDPNSPDYEECLKRRQTSWIEPGLLRSLERIPTLLYGENEEGDLTVQLSSIQEYRN